MILKYAQKVSSRLVCITVRRIAFHKINFLSLNRNYFKYLIFLNGVRKTIVNKPSDRSSMNKNAVPRTLDENADSKASVENPSI